MKALPCLISFAALTGLVLLAVVSGLGATFPFAVLAAQIVGCSCAVGVLGFFLRDYVPDSRHYNKAIFRESVAKQGYKSAAARMRRAASSARQPYAPAATRSPLARFGLRRDPATVS